MARPASARAAELLARLGLEEKAALLSGRDLWTTKPAPAAGIRSLWLADGPHGVRRAPHGNDIGIGSSVPATCFPTLSALGASWDTALARRVGAAIGREARALGVDVVLGPGVNLHRSPLGGRNFEYLSEDPELAGALGAAFVEGLQSEGVGASVKHLAANDQETGRMHVDARVDERALRELHLRPFEMVVTQARPWTVMCAYNRVNGRFASEDPFLLDRVLAEEWGFDGVVVSDWGAVNDRVAGVRAGLHLEMPSSGGVTDAEVVEAVRSGALAEAELDARVAPLLELVARAGGARARADAASAPPPSIAGDAAPAAPALPAELAAAHDALVREAAAGAVVRLRDPDGLLPFDPGRERRLAVIGRFAERPRFQGGGSSQMVPTRVGTAWEVLAAAWEGGAIRFAPGTGPDHEADAAALADARACAAETDAAVVFVGLPDAMEREGADRPHMDLPASHVELVEAVLAAQPRTVVVLVAGAPVALPFAERAGALLLAGLGGQAGGAAVADVLLGRADPGGRLATTWPRRIEDTPCFLSFPGDGHAVRYGESVFLGYRHYDSARVEPLFPFGHGGSYARFAWEDLRVEPARLRDDTPLSVSLRVRNRSARTGSEVVQLYVHDDEARVRRPEQELRAFAKVTLGPGQAEVVRFALGPRAFAFWDETLHAWAREPGGFELRLGASSRDVRLRARVELALADPPRVPFDRHTPIRRFLAEPGPREALLPLVGALAKALFGGAAGDAVAAPAADGAAGGVPDPGGLADGASFFLELPVGKLVGLSRGRITREQVADLLRTVNALPVE